MLNGLGLFEGVAGITKALESWVRPIAYCDIEKYPRSVLLDRMLEGAIPVAPIWTNIRTLRAKYIPISIDAIYGGFPCQDISLAGTGAGLEGHRSGLVFEFLRVVGEFRPQIIFMENVAALSIRGLDRILLELDALGYDAQWTIVSAFEVGSPHLRERLWLAAYSNGKRVREQSISIPRRADQTVTLPNSKERPLANDNSNGGKQGLAGQEVRGWKPESDSGCLSEDAKQFGLEEPRGHSRDSKSGRQASGPFAPGWWESEPNVGRVVNGLPFRVDRIKALGNAAVPQAAREAFKRLTGLTDGEKGNP